MCYNKFRCKWKGCDFLEDLKEIAAIEKRPQMEGRNVSLVIGPFADNNKKAWRLKFI